jgi:hypothetical protein
VALTPARFDFESEEGFGERQPSCSNGRRAWPDGHSTCAFIAAAVSTLCEPDMERLFGDALLSDGGVWHARQHRSPIRMPIAIDTINDRAGLALWTREISRTTACCMD